MRIIKFSVMKTLNFLILLLVAMSSISAQETKARVTVTATGVDINEAKNLALRSAIEQAFGAYISSNTEVLNNELIKDEIISISSGNIDSIHVISETKLVDGRISVSLLAVVSVNKLVTFCESKGYKVEFKGGLFSTNIKQQKLNETAELKALENICEAGKSILNKSFDYSLTISEPQKSAGNGSDEKWDLIYNVSVKPNSNYTEFKNYVYENISRVAMNDDELTNYRSTNKSVFNLKWIDPSNEFEQNRESDYYFRNIQSLALIQDLFWHAKFSLGFFHIASNLDTFDIYNVKMFPRKHLINPDHPVFVIPKSVGYSSSLKNAYEFLEYKASIPAMSENFGIGKIYSLRSNFYKRNLADLEWEKKEALNYAEVPQQIVSRIQRYNQNIVYFYKEKYIFVLQDDNSSGRFEDLWARGSYIDKRDYLKVYLGLDLNYTGQFVFNRSFTLNEIEKITNVEVFPAGQTLGL